MDKIRARRTRQTSFAMGDFNDDPVNASLTKYLGQVIKKNCIQWPLLCASNVYKMFKSVVASLGYRDAPNLFDQIIVSKTLYLWYTSKNYSVSASKYSLLLTSSPNGQYKELSFPFLGWRCFLQEVTGSLFFSSFYKKNLHQLNKL